MIKIGIAPIIHVNILTYISDRLIRYEGVYACNLMITLDAYPITLELGFPFMKLTRKYQGSDTCHEKIIY